MATITEAQAWSQIKFIAKMLNERDLYLSTNSEKLIDHQEDLIDNLRGNAADKISAWSKSFRNTAQSGLSPAGVRQAFAGALEDFCQSINKPIGSFQENMITLYDRMVANSDSINSNNPTYGSISAAGGNTGDGLIYRLTVDENDYTLEGNHQEAKTAYIRTDENQNKEFKEEIGILGTDAEIDFVQFSGSGLKKETIALNGRSPDDSNRIINNADFRISGTQPAASTPATPATTTSITGWTVSATADFEVDIDTVFRATPSQTTPRSVRFKDNGNINQVINASRALSLPRNIPLIRRVAVYRESSCDGTFTFEFGSDTKATTVSTLNNSAWNIITMTFDSNAYYSAYKENNLNIKFTLASRTTGTLYISDLIVAPWQGVDNIYHSAIGGATSWLEDDSYSWTDSEGGRAILMYWLVTRSGISQLLGRPFTLPNDNSGTETISDPT